MKTLFIILSIINITTMAIAQNTKFTDINRVYHEDNSAFRITVNGITFSLNRIYSDGSAWKITGNSTTYNIRRVYSDWNEWEIQSDNSNQSSIHFKTAYNNDFYEWRILDNRTTYYIKAVYHEDYYQWQCSSSKGSLSMQAVYHEDPSQWRITDDLEASEQVKLSLIFAALITAAYKL